MDVQTAPTIETEMPCTVMNGDAPLLRLLAPSGIPPLPPEIQHLAPRPDEIASPAISDEEAHVLADEWAKGGSVKLIGIFDAPSVPMRKAFPHLVPNSPEPKPTER